MASEKNAVLLFTDCKGQEILSSNLPSLTKLKEKGTVLTKLTAKENRKHLALTGNSKVETFEDVVKKENAIVGTLSEAFDLCVMDLPAPIQDLEKSLSEILEKIDRKTLLVLVADGLVVYYGSGVARGKVIAKETCVSTVVATVAYIVNLPLPEGCDAPITLDVLKDHNLKYHEVKKLLNAIENMEAVMERQQRQPWEKHDCA